ncbi:MAG TPA: thiamine phosphate synthase [Terriglobales bacterium]|nr:thiamine phosphate synthase [Terriglobales bacterium]
MPRALLYYITDRTQFPGTETQRRQNLLDKIHEAASCAVDYIQLREKDLSSRDLEKLGRDALDAIRSEQSPTRLLINSRSDIALAVGADGVHLRSHDISVADAKEVAKLAFGHPEPETRNWLVAASCHSEEEVLRAASAGADFVVFAPVFEKAGGSPTGLDPLHRACRYIVPVLALGGVTLENAQSCLDAGAAGIAGIRLFQENDIANVVRRVTTA